MIPNSTGKEGKKMTQFGAGFGLGMLLVLLILVALAMIVTSTRRATAAVLLVGWYERASGTQVVFIERHFTDLDGLSQGEQDAIERLWALHVTAGTGETTFSPDAHLTLGQAFTLLGRTLMLVEQAER